MKVLIKLGISPAVSVLLVCYPTSFFFFSVHFTSSLAQKMTLMLSFTCTLNLIQFSMKKSLSFSILMMGSRINGGFIRFLSHWFSILMKTMPSCCRSRIIHGSSLIAAAVAHWDVDLNAVVHQAAVRAARVSTEATGTAMEIVATTLAAASQSQWSLAL